MTEKQLVKIILEKRPIACSECGGKLHYIGGGEYECMECSAHCLDDFGKVRKYLYEHGPTPAQAICAATGVSTFIVEELLKEGRIEVVENSKIFPRCERCGCAIRYGRICPDCAKKDTEKLRDGMREYIGEKPRVVSMKRHEPQKMRYFDENNNK